MQWWSCHHLMLLLLHYFHSAVVPAVDSVVVGLVVGSDVGDLLPGLLQCSGALLELESERASLVN